MNVFESVQNTGRQEWSGKGISSFHLSKLLLHQQGIACNPSYSGGRDQEDHGSKPVRENSS
jgi:hypothetical protein